MIQTRKIHGASPAATTGTLLRMNPDPATEEGVATKETITPGRVITLAPSLGRSHPQETGMPTPVLGVKTLTQPIGRVTQTRRAGVASPRVGMTTPTLEEDTRSPPTPDGAKNLTAEAGSKIQALRTMGQMMTDGAMTRRTTMDGVMEVDPGIMMKDPQAMKEEAEMVEEEVEVEVEEEDTEIHPLNTTIKESLKNIQMIMAPIGKAFSKVSRSMSRSQ